MAERPILFSAPMVRAILDDRKTVTRRVVRPLKGGFVCVREGRCRDAEGRSDSWAIYASPDEDREQARKGVTAQPGDRVWVKETFYAWGHWETRFNAKKERDEWHFVDLTVESGSAYRYAADEDVVDIPRHAGAVRWWKRPSIFMPRIASRINLEVTAVRLERLQDISEEQARAEGCVALDGYKWHTLDEAAAGIAMHDHTAKDAFEALWEQIHGEGSCNANPWVWVVEFKRVEQEVARG